MENIIWASNITKDKLLNSSKEEKLAKLIELGYDPEMLMTADLDDVIASDDTTFDKDLEEFDDVIALILFFKLSDLVFIYINETTSVKCRFQILGKVI